jgi:hypothetical protein
MMKCIQNNPNLEDTNIELIQYRNGRRRRKIYFPNSNLIALSIETYFFNPFFESLQQKRELNSEQIKEIANEIKSLNENIIDSSYNC